MKTSKVLLAAGLVACAAATASATVRETFAFTGIGSDGSSASSPAAGTAMFTAVGGYSLGRIDVSGTLTSQGIGSWGSESRVRLQHPLGGFVDLQPFPGASTTFTTLSFTGSMYVSPGLDPIGGWTVKTFESFDDGGGVDAIWDALEFRFTDEPPMAPSAIDLGTLPAGVTSASGTLGSDSRIQWYKFTTTADALSSLSTYLDIDTEGSGLAPNNDTEIGLYSEFGALIGNDDDDGSGLLSQLTFGAGTRPPAPPTGSGSIGMSYDGRDGPLPAGTYYLAIASFNTVLSPGFAVTPGTSHAGPYEININTNVPAPGTLALVAVGGLVARRRRA